MHTTKGALTSVLGKAARAVVDSLRSWCLCENGLAGLALLQEEPRQAVTRYQAVLGEFERISELFGQWLTPQLRRVHVRYAGARARVKIGG